MSKLTVARALTAAIARRITILATWIALAVFVVMIIICWALAYFFSPWWWLLIIPFVVLLGVFLVIRLIVLFIVKRIHGDNLTKHQRSALNEFADKIWGLLEARSTPIPIIVLISIKDILFHQDITTIKSFIADTASLRRDYEALERLF